MNFFARAQDFHVARAQKILRARGARTTFLRARKRKSCARAPRARNHPSEFLEQLSNGLIENHRATIHGNLLHEIFITLAHQNISIEYAILLLESFQNISKLLRIDYLGV